MYSNRLGPGIALLALLIAFSPSHAGGCGRCETPPVGCEPASGFVPLPPISYLEVCTVVDEACPCNGQLDQYDIDAALDRCANTDVFGTTGGCNLFFPEATYDNVSFDIDSRFAGGFAAYGDTQNGSNVSVLRAPLYSWPKLSATTQDNPPVFPVNDSRVIEVTGTAPDFVVLQDLALDGRKSDQPLPPTYGPQDLCPDQAAAGNDPICWRNLNTVIQAVYAGNPTHDPVFGATIENLEIREFLGTGISIRDADNWVVADNFIHHLGCHLEHEECGPIWAAAPSIDGIPGRQTNGHGVFLTTHNTHINVHDNVVEWVTKIGFESIGGGDAAGKSCNDPTSVQGRYLTFSDNEARYSGIGFKMFGGCDYVVEDNLSEYNLSPGVDGDTGIDWGIGFELRQGGTNSVWQRNTARNNKNAGFAIRPNDGSSCWIDNVSEDNCQRALDFGWGSQHGDVSIEIEDVPFTDNPPPPSPDPTDITITNMISDSPLCDEALSLGNATGKTLIDGGTWTGGAQQGMQILPFTEIANVENAVVTKGAGLGDTGVLFGTGFPGPGVCTTGGPCGVYFQDSVTITGFQTESQIDAPANVGYCPDTNQFPLPDPHCCKVGNILPADCALFFPTSSCP